jgi:hypothetical protein
MIQNRQFKLILDPYGGETQLFDLLDDPYETRDLSSVNPKIARELKDSLIAWMRHSEKIAAELPASGGTGADPSSSLLDELDEGGY